MTSRMTRAASAARSPSGRSPCSLVLALVAGAALVAGRALLLDERTHGSADAVALAAASVLEGATALTSTGGAPATFARRRAPRARLPGASRNGSARRWSRSVRARAARPVAAERCASVRLSTRGPAASARAGIGFARPAPRGRLPDRRRTRPGRSGRGRRRGARPARLAVRVGRREQGRGRIRLLGPRRLRARRGRATGRAPRRRGPAATRAPLAAGARRCCRATSCSSACRRTTSGSSSAPGLADRGAAPRSARCTSSRSATAAGPAPGGSCRRAAGGADGDGDLGVPAYVPVPLRALVARAARAEQVPPALLAAQLEAESGFDASARLAARAPGHRAVHARQHGPATGTRSASAARSSPARRSRPGAPRCTTCSSAPAATSPSALAAYNAGPAVLPANGRARRARTWRASCAASNAGGVHCRACLDFEAAGGAPPSGRTRVRLC